ncbi:DUF6011 domain-containing protein [Streptomyces sp. NPDC002755]
MTATCTCGRTLRDPVSIARGLGPVCHRRLNGPPAVIRTPAAEISPGQTELELRPMQPTLWSL